MEQSNLQPTNPETAFIKTFPCSGCGAKLGFKPTGDIVARLSRARGHTVPTRLFALDFGDAEGSGDAIMPRMLAA